ncbi:MAG: cellulose biosynthesis cyclic di-GMP-binding regulatory protein BcsB, partial [Lysobacteraceae bacterium]
MIRFPAIFLLACLCATNLPAQAPAAGPPAAEAPAPATPASRVLRLGFKELGASGPLMLRGVEGSIGLPFSIRSDEVVVGAKLRMDYQYSPSLLEELSHLVVTLNDEVAATIALPKGQGMGNRREIDLDPRLFIDHNKLAFRLIGHYTYRCEDPTHSSLWLSLAQSGSLELTLAPLALANDLRLLPNPFFDPRDQGALRLPFVFEEAPSPGMMKAAGIVASWFGGQASYRGASFPVRLEGLPSGHAVLFRRRPSPAGEAGPAIEVQAHPSVPGAKLLILSGADDEALQRAARALVFSNGGFSGPRVVITSENLPAPRKPYDAPAWLPVDRPVRFGEVMALQDMQVRGYYPDVIRMNFRVAPDLFTWRSEGVPIDLKYRFTRLPFNKNSSLNISLNNNFIHALALN